MRYILKDEKTGGDLLLFKNEPGFDRLYFSRDRFNKYFTIAWNPGEKQTVTIDGTEHDLPPNTLLTLLFNQSFSFERSEEIIAWQFNREFYCLIDHDKEVSCVGFLFGSTDHILIRLQEEAQEKLKLLSAIFMDEFKTTDNIQNEMLLALLKRLISYITRLARSEYVPEKKVQEEKYHLIRKFNLLVEMHFKEEHSVSFYAQQLFKSPKTLSNLFAIYNNKTPSQVIQERILIEAKRLLTYTSKTVKQITFELGFEDVSYFSNFFKKHTSLSPVDFRHATPVSKEGK
ncbi:MULTISPECIES: helix-turn-helix domain-containing protein [Niastella]|uniref:Helix-turn-helix domain-containing protein n=1 Tax=Niastella soli TaxID=2821487 RepID=A0ABS3YVF7_9BACT|nr:helix-turn-helix domain-containing protein [Niastella soli]MBO9201863.1 helix-turn-helix domain-containing protein [Niastella soli]